MTSQSRHQHNPSSTFATNIDVASLAPIFNFLSVVSELLLCTFPFLLVLAFVEYYVVPGEKGMAISTKTSLTSL